MKLLWANQLSGVGNAYGYSSQAVNMKQALADLGITLCFDAADDYDLALHIITPDHFSPIPGKINILWTMYESTSIPDSWVKPINTAQVLMVPCQHNRDLFRRYFKGPIEVCQLGIDPVRFPFYQRKLPDPGEPFRFLWLGAPNARKGYEIVEFVAKRWLQAGKMPRNVQFYFKTSGTSEIAVKYFKAYRIPSKPTSYEVYQHIKVKGKPSFYDTHFRYQSDQENPNYFLSSQLPAGVPAHPSIIHDTRNMSNEELTALYNSAHAFLLPSLGEGWGLTLCEAMATGAPCIWTHYSGPRDFADESIGYPVTKFDIIPITTLKFTSGAGPNEGTGFVAKEGWHTEVEAHSYAASADGPQLIQRMEQIYYGYAAALERGRKASERMHALYKWSDAGRAFLKCVEKYVKEANSA
jgi:glycosyltransferase involved in cell wall biosynthesis